MRFLEYSLESYRVESITLAKIVGLSGYKPDCVAYFACGAWQIGKECSEYFRAPIVELSTHRSGNATKEQAHLLLMKLPRYAKYLARQCEMALRLRNTGKSDQDKTICITDRFEPPKEARRILIVDDSADTGVSVKLGKHLLQKMYPLAEIRVAVINSFAPAREAELIDWSLREDCLLSTPMSKDNVDYKRACHAYLAFGCHESGDNI